MIKIHRQGKMEEPEELKQERKNSCGDVFLAEINPV